MQSFVSNGLTPSFTFSSSKPDRMDEANKNIESSKTSLLHNDSKTSNHSEALKTSANSTAFSKAAWDIFVGGKSVGPEERMNIEGVSSAYISNMSESEYVEALNKAANLAGAKASEELRNIASGTLEKSEITSRPSFIDSNEAESTLHSYVSALLSDIDTRNMFFDQLNSEDVKQFNVEKYGLEQAEVIYKRDLERIISYEDLIENETTSISIIYDVDKSTLTKKEDGVIKFEGFQGEYRGNGFNYQFLVLLDGRIEGKK